MPLVFTQNEVTLSGHLYADVIGETYEFPSRYLRLIRSGEQFLYYRGRRRKAGRGNQEYFGCGIVAEVFPSGDRYQCSIADYHPFDPPVPFKSGDRYREPEANEIEHVGLYFQLGVRRIDQKAFDSICNEGLKTSEPVAAYATASAAQEVDKIAMALALAEAANRWPTAEICRMPHNNPGFDIEIRLTDGSVHYIEVKGTRSHEPRFFISSGEIEYSLAHAAGYSIWIYHSIDLDRKTGGPYPRILDTVGDYAAVGS
uniref:protein NO VEIN domain-containing protein n=1 Tax=Gordonia paraffinivorans TaxID=175628 RepID=UPI0024320A37